MARLRAAPAGVVRVMLGALLLQLANGDSGEVYQANCRDSLGMQSGDILNHLITASSSYDIDSVGPQNARIRNEERGGAWCPKSQISHNVYEWLQIDLQELKVISLVETQGRFGNGQGQEFAEMYMLEYQRHEGEPWKKHRNRKGQEIFQGNKNTYIAELREINPPIIARKIRFIPFSNHPRTVCMRVELYGCRWKDGIVSYNMPQGDRRGAEVDLYDFTYDGTINDGYLSGGLGQLTDGQEGNTNFRLDPQGLGKKGYAWVGWKNDSNEMPPIEIIFKFDKVRNFSSIKVHCNNMFSKDVRVFRMAKIFFTVGGKYYTQEPVVYEYMRDTLMEFARWVIIPIPYRIARYVKVQLYFDARWIMIGEIQLESEVAVGNFTEEVAPPFGASTVDPVRAGVKPRGPQILEVDFMPETGGVPGGAKVGTNATPDAVVNSHSKEKNMDDESIGIIIGALTALILLLFLVGFILIIRHRKRKHGQANQRMLKSFEPRHVTLNLNDLRLNTTTAAGVVPQANGKVVNGNMYNSVATSDLDLVDKDTAKFSNLVASAYGEPFDGIQTRKLPELPKTPESTDTNTSREYAVPDLTKSSLIVNVPPSKTPSYQPNIYREETPPPPPLPPHPRALYGSSDIINFPNIQGVSGNNVYAVPNADLLWKEDYSVMEFPREQLKFKEKLGEGQFGEVHLCEAQRITDFLGDDFLVNRTGSRNLLVAVKMLRKNADDHAREDFHKEVKIMSKLKDNNIVRVLGVCTQDDPLCVIVEYMKYGDLNQFLRNHYPEGTTMSKKKQKEVKTLSYGCLIYMATQMASGMKYLETLNMVHRDLATRNCLVGHQYTIKISDFGMSRSLYSCDYYRIEGRAVLPIRWMAWESVLLGKFSSKSDVWSFAVSLWEILTFARDQPFEGLSDEQVIENCGHYYRNDSQEVYLPQPGNCPKEIYDLMKECWNRDELCRPAFREIHMFLQRKNMGYNPRDEKMLANGHGMGTLNGGHTGTNGKISVPIV